MLFVIKASTLTALLRLVSGLFEVGCAVIIYLKQDPKTIVRLSALMGILGPLALLVGLIVGLSSMTEIPFWRIFIILLGAILLIIGSFT